LSIYSPYSLSDRTQPCGEPSLLEKENPREEKTTRVERKNPRESLFFLRRRKPSGKEEPDRKEKTFLRKTQTG